MKIHPKRMNWIVKRLAWIVVVVVALLVVVAAIRYKSRSRIQAVNVQIKESKGDLAFINDEVVKNIIFKKFSHYLEGQTLEHINIEQLEKALQENMFIKKADAYVDAQNVIHIAIEQRQPIVRIIDVTDPSYYLDADTNRIMLSDQYTARVLTVTGDIGIYVKNFDEIEDNRLRKVFKLVMFIIKNEFWNAQIEQIFIDHTGEATLVPKLGDQKIYFGYPDELIEDKFKRLETFYKEGMPREGWEKYQSISVAFKNQVVCKKR